MPFVIYAAPNYTENAVRFIHTILAVPNVQIGLVSQEPKEWLPQELSARLAGFRQVKSVFDADELEAAARSLAEYSGEIHRITGAVEPLQEVVSQVRERLGIEGMATETVLNFRDKSRMKNLLRAAGLPCAHHCLAASAEEALAFANENGYPVVVKPPDGAGAQSTFRANNAGELQQALHTLSPSPERRVLLEEFIVGDEFSFDVFSLKGKPLFHTINHYLPNPLEVLREPWIQWRVLLPHETEAPENDDIREEVYKALKTLGMGTGISHTEWFRRKDGSLAISEIAARPPGAQFTTLISRACDFDAISAWARLVFFGEFDIPERKYAAGGAYLRGQGHGKVVAVHGLEQVQREVGHLITDAKIPKIGQEKAQSYEGEGYIIVRHPETVVVQEALLRIVSTVRVVLG